MLAYGSSTVLFPSYFFGNLGRRLPVDILAIRSGSVLRRRRHHPPSLPASPLLFALYSLPQRCKRSPLLPTELKESHSIPFPLTHPLVKLRGKRRKWATCLFLSPLYAQHFFHNVADYKEERPRGNSPISLAIQIEQTLQLK